VKRLKTTRRRSTNRSDAVKPRNTEATTTRTGVAWSSRRQLPTRNVAATAPGSSLLLNVENTLLTARIATAQIPTA